jgi:lysophospholipase L1-like esterase
MRRRSAGLAQAGNGLLTRRRTGAFAAVVVAALIIGFAAAAFGGLFSGPKATAATTPSRLKTARSPAALPAQGARTSCTSVAHIGDSTSVGMVSPAWLPDAAQRLAAQYRDVGVRHVQTDASGGRSIVEELPGQQNGYRVATAWYGAGYRGCWVIALGTNDAANIAVGSNVGAQARIAEMMAAAHGEPVLWVNTQTDLTSGPWAESNMQQWNSALVQASAHYPNMRIFNWAAMVQPGWYLSDGIHYTSAGYAIRAAAIAHALTLAFPADGHSKTAVVNEKVSQTLLSRRGRL